FKKIRVFLTWSGLFVALSGGETVFGRPFCAEYTLEKEGFGDLLLTVVHPLHLQLLSENDCNNVTVLNDFKYKSIDSELVGVVGCDPWLLKTNSVFVTWHFINGVKEELHYEIVSVPLNDVEGLNSSAITRTSSYFYGKLIARLALIAEEVCFLDVIPKVKKYLKEIIEPWLDGAIKENGFLYDQEWRVVVTKQGCSDSSYDFGSEFYTSRLYHLRYFLDGIVILVNIDPCWGKKYKCRAYSLMQEFMNLSTCSNPNYTHLRCFDLYKFHSWAGGLKEFEKGRYQKGTSEAVIAYYSARLIGLEYGDANVVTTGPTLTALLSIRAQMWWHVREAMNMREENFRPGFWC
ncbi:probable endo-1,3(4)-beta-glucanase ARB_01444, partial [Medicago truncatula]|uniref:probable endo-1,3(4)-beta-glucanase ARB_01444 n=1 Tax=Medicago truncatula TaxID=3880 RepID=UPI001967EC66